RLREGTTLFFPQAMSSTHSARLPALAPEIQLELTNWLDALSTVALLCACKQLYVVLSSTDAHWKRRYYVDYPAQRAAETELPQLFLQYAPARWPWLAVNAQRALLERREGR